MVGGLIQPQHDLPTRASRQHLVQPAERRIGVLPVNHKRRDFFPRPQMHRAIEVLGGFTPCPIGNQGLLSHRVPAPSHCSFQVNFALIPCQWGDLNLAGSQFR